MQDSAGAAAARDLDVQQRLGRRLPAPAPDHTRMLVALKDV
jgi:hypothetical protein